MQLDLWRIEEVEGPAWDSQIAAIRPKESLNHHISLESQSSEGWVLPGVILLLLGPVLLLLIRRVTFTHPELAVL